MPPALALAATPARALATSSTAPRGTVMRASATTAAARHHRRHQRRRERVRAHASSSSAFVAATPSLASSSSSSSRRREPISTTPRAIDAAQPFDFESKARKKIEKSRTLTIGIVGFGNFGQFLAKRFVKCGHDVIATSRGDYYATASELGVAYYRDPDDFCEAHPDVVIFATSILSTETTINAFPTQRLRRNTLVCDVLSVKQFPKQLFLTKLPENFDIVCLHPMFGPDSGKGSWKDLPLVYDKVSETGPRTTPFAM
jgi:arogenate dehydrogenase (NADP+)